MGILDASDPSQIVRLGDFPEVFFQPAIRLFGDYASVLTSDSSDPLAGGANTRRFLNIYDISDPAAPVWVNQANVVDFLTKQSAVFVQGRYAYVAAPGVFSIVDVQDPAQPQIAGTLVDPNLTIEDGRVPIAIQVREGYAYLTTGEQNEKFFHIVDVSDPEAPTFVSTFSFSSEKPVTDLVISGKYLYLGLYWGAFWVYDISNPVAPVLVTTTAGLPFGGWGASWSLGGLTGEYLAVPALSRFHLVDVPRDTQALSGPVTVLAHLAPLSEVFLPLLFR
jgi:hypothetical protein